MEPLNDSRSRKRHRSLEQDPAQNGAPPSSRRRRSRPPISLRCVHDSSNDKGQPGSKTEPVDIFAIHGLDTKSPDTWIWKDNPKDPQSREVNCLADEDMFPSRVGPSRIFTCDWPAELFESLEFAEHTFEELAALLLEGILGHHEKHRPILFIASCLGGVILMKALNMATDDSYLSIKLDTRAIVFLSTPFRGTAFQEVATWAEPGLKAWARSQGCRVTRWLDFAKESASEVGELTREFTQTLKEKGCEVSTFYEKGYTNLRRKIPYIWFLFPSNKKILVNRESGTLEWDARPLSLDRTHVQMNKFNGPNDPDYELVAGRIEQHLQKVRDGTPLQRADACIRRHYEKGRLKIVRLSGDLLEMSQCYINLAIIKQRKDTATNTSSHTSPFSLSSRLEMNTPHKDLLVELPALFSSRESSHGHTKEPRRILIRGRAGVGKTTLCKKIIYDFMYGKMWETLFSRILWVPLRELKVELPRYDLGEMFRHLYFNREPDGKMLAKTLWDTIKKTNYRDTLFILDGLDEVSELSNSQHPAFGLLTGLLDSPNVIITTRPYTRLPSAIEKCNQELETIGFDLDQIDDYIGKVVRSLGNVEEIRSFLEKHQLLQSLVRIPILLDALCLTWDESFRSSSISETLTGPISETMTAVYSAIAQRLWKKDIIRLNKFAGGSPGDAHISEIEEKTEAESEALERLAFSGMYSNVVEFQSEHRNDIRKLVKPNTDGRVFDELLGNLSFLRSSDPLGSIQQRSYHFLHLTFQELFAAKYFARQWKAGKELEFHDFKTRKLLNIKPGVFLGQEKYTGRYDIVWRFTVGLLQTGEVHEDEVRANSVKGFFEALGREPIDLIGPVHQRLVMHCLSEVDTREREIRLDLEPYLSQWLLLRCDLPNAWLMLDESEFPESVVIGALKGLTGRQRLRIIDYLSEADILLSEAVITGLVEVMGEKNCSRDLCDLVGGIVRYQSNLSEATITRLAMLISDEGTHEDARNAAASVLAAQPRYLEAAFVELVDIEKGKMQKRPTVAGTQALGKQSNSSELVVTRLFAGEKAESRIKLITSELSEIPENLSEAAVAACMWLIENTDGSIQRSAATALQEQTKLSEDTIITLAELIRNEPDTPNILNITKILYNQRKLPGVAITSLFEVLESERGNEHTRSDIALFISDQESLSKTFMTRLLELIVDGHANDYVRRGAAMSLPYRKKLSETTIEAFIKLIENKSGSEGFRYQIGDILQRQSSLPETPIATLNRLFRDEYSPEISRYIAINVLSVQRKLPEDTIVGLAIGNGRESMRIRQAALRSLWRQTELSEKTIAVLVRLIENENESTEIRSAAAGHISRRTALPEETITVLVKLIENENESMEIRQDVLEILGKRTELSEETIIALTGLIENEQEMGPIPSRAALALGSQTNLPIAALTALLRAIKNKNIYDRRVRFRAAEALDAQTSLPEAIIHSLIALYRTEDIRIDTAHILGELPNLLEKIIKTVKSISESGRTSEVFDFLKFFYGSFLYCGLEEQFCLYVEDGNLVFYLPGGSRVKIKVPPCEVLAAIDEGRRLIPPLSKYSNLWLNDRMASGTQSVRLSA